MPLARLSAHAGATISSSISLLMISSHAFFLYAQLSGLWTECGPLPPLGPGICEQDVPLDPGGLMRADLKAHVEYDAAGILSTGLQALTSGMCYAKGVYTECPKGRHTPLANTSDTTAAVCGLLECGGLDFADALLHISYFYSIEHLWIQPGPTQPGVHYEQPIVDCTAETGCPGRTAAGMLFFWSFLWPHVKLLLLHAFFYLALRASVRRNGNFVLAFFGKWSLADVLVMACVLALFDLDIDLSLVDVWQHLHTSFTPLCDAICLTTYFSNATNLSGIDFGNASAPLPPSNCSVACALVGHALSAGVTPNSLPSSEVHVNLSVHGLGAMYAFCVAVLISLSTGVWIDLVAVVGTITLPSFERRITGSLSHMLEAAGIDFTSRVSMWSIPGLTVRGGGFSWLMAAVFAFFIIVAPVLRTLSLLALLLLPMKRATAKRLHVLSRRLVCYTALDVMLIATPLIGAAFGPMSEALLNKDVLPLCGTLGDIYAHGDDGATCLRIDVVPTDGYWFNVGAVVLMLLSGFDGSPTSKFIHRRLFPHDPNPPPSLDCAE